MVELEGIHHQAKEGSITVYEKSVLRETCPLQGSQDFVQIIDRAPHSCAYVDVDDGWSGTVLLQTGLQVLVVYFTAFKCLDLRQIEPGMHATGSII